MAWFPELLSTLLDRRPENPAATLSVGQPTILNRIQFCNFSSFRTKLIQSRIEPNKLTMVINELHANKNYKLIVKLTTLRL